MTSHVQFFGDSERTFALKADQILELQRLSGVGLGELCRRVFSGSFYYDDLRHTIRLALIGGGTDPNEAAALVAAYVEPRPLEVAMILTTDVLSAVYFGSKDEGPVREEPGELDSEALK